MLTPFKSFREATAYEESLGPDHGPFSASVEDRVELSLTVFVQYNGARTLGQGFDPNKAVKRG
jgi:hypothetical protein